MRDFKNKKGFITTSPVFALIGVILFFLLKTLFPVLEGEWESALYMIGVLIVSMLLEKLHTGGEQSLFMKMKEEGNHEE